MALTPKREAFVLAYVRLGVAARAYAESHEASRMAPATIRKRAAELLKLPEVQARLTELQGQAAKAAVLDRAVVLRDLQRVARMAMGDEPVRKLVMKGRGKDKREVTVEAPMIDLRAACRALELIGKSDEVKLFVERHEHSGKDGAPLIPGEVEPRALARAVVDILRQAALSDAPPPAAADDEPPEDLEEERDGELPSSGSPAVADLAAAVVAAVGGRASSTTAATAPTPRPLPTTLESGERELQDNGSEVIHDAEFNRYAIHSADGRLVGYRADLDAARALAVKQKPPDAKERR